MFDLNSKSIDILSSREGVRDQLVTYAQEYLELENVDLYKTSFLSYVINVLSILTSNQIYYTSSIYREFFLTEAQMRESVYNLAKWIGYIPPTAVPATCDVLISLPLTFKDDNITFTIPDDFKIQSGNIVYTIDSQITIKSNLTEVEAEYTEMETAGLDVRVLGDGATYPKSVTVRSPSGFFFPVMLDREEQTASFYLPFVQFEKIDYFVQVPNDLEIYQFWSTKVEWSAGQVWNIEISEEIPAISALVNSTWTKLEQAENNSLYTMTSTEKKYVWSSSDNKAEIFFGNGIIGKQPEPGSTIKISLYVTQGEGGKVIAGSLTNPDRIYYESTISGSTKTQPIKLDVTNPKPAEGGGDSPTIAEIKNNAIANLRSKGRLVSDTDYDDFNEIFPDIPLSSAMPVLKRSDLKVNEIEMFTKLNFKGEIAPTRNDTYDLIVDATSVEPVLTIPARSTKMIDGEEYETIFSINIDNISDVAEYYYTMQDVDVTPSLETISTYAQFCYIIISTINFKRNELDELEIFAEVSNIFDEILDFKCEMTTIWDGQTYTMFNETDPHPEDPSGLQPETYPPVLNGFYVKLDNYIDVPVGNQMYRFVISGIVPANRISDSSVDEEKVISEYVAENIVRKDLSDFMMSMITDSTCVHNIPYIKTDFLADDDDRKDFEASTIQTLINSIDVNSKKMLTDFINVKFCDTTGILSNMNYNKSNLVDVLSNTLTIEPLGASDGDRYIVNGKESTAWSQYKDKIAQYSSSTSSWEFLDASINDSILIKDTDTKVVWAGNQWFVPEFDIPFRLDMTITRDRTYQGSLAALVDNIKTALLNEFAPTFGLDINIDRSEIIKTVRGVTGVLYVKLHAPVVDIRFTYNVPNDLPMEYLIDYTPQLVAFSTDTIDIHIKEA